MSDVGKDGGVGEGWGGVWGFVQGYRVRIQVLGNIRTINGGYRVRIYVLGEYLKFERPQNNKRRDITLRRSKENE